MPRGWEFLALDRIPRRSPYGAARHGDGAVIARNVYAPGEPGFSPPLAPSQTIAVLSSDAVKCSPGL